MRATVAVGTDAAGANRHPADAGSGSTDIQERSARNVPDVTRSDVRSPCRLDEVKDWKRGEIA